MDERRKSRSIAVTPKGLEKVRQTICELVQQLDQDVNGWSQEELHEWLAQKAGVSPSTVKRFLNRTKIDRPKFAYITQALKLKAEDITEQGAWDEELSIHGQEQESLWKQVCQDILRRQQKTLLTSYPLGVARRVPDVYVPLELVERQAKPRLKEDSNPESFSVREQEEKTMPVSHEAFFNSVLKGQSPKSQGRRIAIIGEPGAGKTTLLQEISTRVDGIPIWIDLASLKRNDTLEEYLLHTWLRASLSEIRKYVPQAVSNVLEPSADLQQAFTELFHLGEVWLLLDGADEMSAELGQSLNWIAQQLSQSGWIAKAKVVLTSRLNLWNDYGDRLIEFDTYRNLDFEPKQVTEFIDNWFAETPNNGDKLKKDLEKASDRIKSLIRNPLRLTLLCLTWKGLGDKLPETKAGLYQRLVRSHYEHKWKTKPDNFAKFENEEEQDKLNRWLGELSKTALDGKDPHFKESKFRFRRGALTYFAKQFEQGSELLKWALKLEWLQPIGLPSLNEVDADEPVYAFLHPTFQEYFAALAIDDCDYFLPQNHQDKPISDAKGSIRYRIFESQWKEVFLLWLGRENIERTSKEELVLNLREFNDNCNHYYSWHAFFLAAESLSEFRSENSDQILEILIHCACYRDLGSIHLSGRATKIACRIDKTLIKQNLLRFINSTSYNDIKSYAIQILEEVDHNEQQVQTILNSNPELKAAHSTKNIEGFDILNGLDLEAMWRRFINGKISSLGLEEYHQNRYNNPDKLILKLLALVLKFEGEKNKTKLEDLIPVFDSIFKDSFLNNQTSLKSIVSTLGGLPEKALFWGNYSAWLWECSQKMSYPDFYRAWHSSSADADPSSDNSEAEP